MKQKTWITIIALLTVVALLSTACAAPAAAPAAAPTGGDAAAPAAPAAAPAEGGKKILRVAYGAEIDTLNALTSQNLTDIEITMVDGLIMSDNNNSYVPVLAKEIPTTENGGIVTKDDGTIEMTWHLQEGVKWHDGEEFTSADVCFTLDFIQSEAGEAVYNQTDYMGIKECQMPDPYTVVFVWDKPFGAYATLFDTDPAQARAGGSGRADLRRLQSQPARHGALQVCRVETGRVHPRREEHGLLARRRISHGGRDRLQLHP